MRLVIAAAIGLIFGLGISISGMMNPAKILNFFDFAGSWDPSLAFVLAGALPTTFVGYRLVWRRGEPLFGSKFMIPTIKHIDGRLIAGAIIFGVGWGISGFCPGATIPALGAGRWEVWLFLAAFIAGLGLARLLNKTDLFLPMPFAGWAGMKCEEKKS